MVNVSFSHVTLSIKVYPDTYGVTQLILRENVEGDVLNVYWPLMHFQHDKKKHL